MSGSDTPLLASRIVKAIELANELREVFDLPRLDDLPKGVRRDPARCILARAFNFECRVECNGAGVWFVTFPAPANTSAREKAEAFVDWALENSLKVEETSSHRVRVFLPSDVGYIARDFDLGKLPQYG